MTHRISSRALVLALAVAFGAPILTTILAQSAQAQTCDPPPSGLKSWWPGDGNANDIWGGNGGTLQGGATFATGEVGEAFSFDANGDVDVPDAASLNPPTGQITVDAWVNPASQSAGGSIVNKRPVSNATGYTLEQQYTADGDVLWNLVVGGVEVNVVSDTVLPLDTWTLVAGTYDGKTATLYFNGTEVGSTSHAGSIDPSPGADLQIGRNLVNGIEFAGLIDEVEVFDRALSQAEIMAIVSAGSAGKCKPVPVAGKLKISPAKLNFGTVKLNSPKIKKLKIANAGKTTKKNQPSPITIQTESETGTPIPDPFSVTMECSSDPLEPSGKGVSKSTTFCDVAVQFEPTQAVSYTGTLTVFDDLEPSGKQTISLTGKGKAPK